MGYIFDKKVIILATGGTIAGVGEFGRSVGYTSGQISAEQLIDTVPGLRDIAPIEARQVCNLNSDDITGGIWIDIARRIEAEALREDVAGFVITHGTDTMEETAYFLNLTIKTRKPVVITGAMLPSTFISADGPMNLYQAVSVAANPISSGRGVMMVFSNQIYSARDVIKMNTHSMTAMSGGESGALGTIQDSDVYFYAQSEKKHTFATEFDASAIDSLPKVGIVYFHVGCDVSMVKYAASINSGLVIAGAGAGEASLEMYAAIDSVDVPVVLSSRTGAGIITKGNLHCKKAIAANNLPPQKAAILLSLALTRTSDRDEIEQMFEKY
ncbi:MAG: asparaginase [Bacteroidales bacterium]|nr:asparaginase [Bacteroidales bacterium]